MNAFSDLVENINEILNIKYQLNRTEKCIRKQVELLGNGKTLKPQKYVYKIYYNGKCLSVCTAIEGSFSVLKHRQVNTFGNSTIIVRNQPCSVSQTEQKKKKKKICGGDIFAPFNSILD